MSCVLSVMVAPRGLGVILSWRRCQRRTCDTIREYEFVAGTGSERARGILRFLLLSRPLLTNRRALVEVDEVAGRAGLGRPEKHAQDDGNLTSRFRRESNSRVMDALGYADGGRSYA